jgi:pilus assembly protein CpaF
MSALNHLVSEAIDVVVHCTRVGGVPQVSEIIAVEELQTGADAASFTTTQLFARARHDGPLRPTGDLPVRCGRAFDEAGYDLRLLLGTAP